MTDKESLIDTLDCIESKPNGYARIATLNIIANLIRELNNRKSKAKYKRSFDLGKLIITVEFDGMN